jgi:hypothetical protein
MAISPTTCGTYQGFAGLIPKQTRAYTRHLIFNTMPSSMDTAVDTLDYEGIQLSFAYNMQVFNPGGSFLVECV